MVTPFFPGQQQINPRSRFRTPPVKMHGLGTFQPPLFESPDDKVP